ncbi:MAG: cysteine--tRNA ligase [Candidatus Hydrothermarchaeales archaeon]
MPIKFYNTLTGEKEVFTPLKKGEVKLYACGPTVYDFAHIGNFRTYVFQDLMRRWLEYRGYDVTQVMNITDVDEKTIERAKRKKTGLFDITRGYTKAFFEDLSTLNIEKAEYRPLTSDHIEDMVRLTARLIEKGYAYKTEDGSVYFDVGKFSDYGKLSGLEPKAGLRAKTKREDYTVPKHFALWKAWDEMDYNIAWESEFGRGRPTWHVECSALALRFLGDTMDIYSGGIDLVFPHHENGIAVSEAATGKPFANYWMHSMHLKVDGKKMSKSLGNFYTLRDLLKKGYSPRAIRLLLLATHYREDLDFTFDKLEEAEKEIHRLDSLIEKLEKIDDENPDGHMKDRLKEMQREFEKHMDDDLRIAAALKVFFEFIDETEEALTNNNISKEDAKEISKTIKDLDKVLAIM